jgi:hypothetical protein
MQKVIAVVSILIFKNPVSITGEGADVLPLLGGQG